MDGRQRTIESAAVSLSFLLYAAVAAPVPALNEPHYLAKAKHFWNPAWCAGDFFLESVNAHTVFYVTLGWLTLFLPLSAVAWIGRITALALLGTGWSAFTRHLLPQRGAAFVSAWLFLGLQSIGNWSGEWVIGGIESKVYTFGLLLWAAAWALDEKLIRAAAACGLGIAFHPVVGLWALLAVMGAWLLSWCATAVSAVPAHSTLGTSAPPTRPWHTKMLAGIVFLLTALPGLVPVVRLLAAPVDPQTRYAGTFLQVYHRLNHHLDPMLFPRSGYLCYLGLLVIWCATAVSAVRACGTRGLPARPPRPWHTAKWRWLHGVVFWAVIFAATGVIVGYGPRPAHLMPGYEWRMHLLKFYPFRLADALLPMTIAWLATAAVQVWSQSRMQNGAPVLAVSRASWLLAIVIASTLWRGWTLANAERYQASQDADWIAACRWMREHTPADAVVHTPHFRWTFKWHAERAEYVTFKDCPQDVTGIVEWNRRLQLLTKRFQDGYADGVYTWDELHALHEETGITHLITDRLGPMNFPPVYQNATFRVYDLTAPFSPPSPDGGGDARTVIE